MERLVEFLSTPVGRWVRIGAGAFLVANGVATGRPGRVLLGALPLIGGLTDYVFLAAFLGLPPKGRTLRRELGILQEAPLIPPVPRPEQPTYASA
jgi:hypothetical protein